MTENSWQLTPKIISGPFRTVCFPVDGDDHIFALVEEPHLSHGVHKFVDGHRLAQEHVNYQIHQIFNVITIPIKYD